MVNINLLRQAERVIVSEGRVVPVFIPAAASAEDRLVVRSLQELREASTAAMPVAVESLKALIATLHAEG